MIGNYFKIYYLRLIITFWIEIIYKNTKLKKNINLLFNN